MKLDLCYPNSGIAYFCLYTDLLPDRNSLENMLVVPDT